MGFLPNIFGAGMFKNLSNFGRGFDSHRPLYKSAGFNLTWLACPMPTLDLRLQILGFTPAKRIYASAGVTSVRVKSSPLNNNGSFIAFDSA
jgi:hypothetical protein